MEHVRLLLMHILQFPMGFLQVPVQTAPATSAPAANDLTMMIATFISQIKVNGFASFVIQKLKDSKTPALSWISVNTPWVTRFLAVGAASLTAIGIHWTFTGSTLMVTGLSLGTIVPTLYNVAQNYLFQHAWYKLAFGGNGAAPAMMGTGGQVAKVAPGD